MPLAPNDRPLWLLVRGASFLVVAAWLAWTAAALAAAPTLVGALGAAGGILPVCAAGWLLARHVPVPADWLRRYHVDDAEVSVLGPGRRVRRLPWEQVNTVTQERGALRLDGGGLRVALPLAPVLHAAAFASLLARVVPALADAMWTRLDDGEEVRLAARADPRLAALAWWCFVPALGACLAGGASAETALALALVERAVAAVRAHLRSVSLHRTGVALRGGLGGRFVSWRQAEVVRAAEGLVVGGEGDAGGLVATRLPNFWAAAPVIETRAQLAPGMDRTVTFRVRVAEGRLAVVGEID
jgi:hypothetical protein